MLKYGSHRHVNTSNNNAKNKWAPYKDLLIHSSLFKKGIIAVTPKHIPSYSEVEENKSFYIKNRHFYFTNLTNKNAANSPNESQLKQILKLLSELIKFTTRKNGGTYLTYKSDFVLFDKRHEEIFLPLIFQNASSNSNEQQGIYLHPWISHSKSNIAFDGFEIFHTVGCLFGSALKAMDQHGSILELIKHDIKFFPGQILEYIIHNPDEANPYEEILFNEFKKFVNLINNFATPNQPKQLVYHLPYYDYILFGIELFIHGKITRDALGALFLEIMTKKEQYTKKLTEICSEHSINLQIESPFENLFGQLNNPASPIDEILSKLNLADFDPTEANKLDKTERDRNEQQLVTNCLQELKINQFNPKHRSTWEDFVDSNKNKIETIEDLLKVGNAVILGAAAKGKANNKVCSILPISEKQIQLEYSNYCKFFLEKRSNQPTYPTIINITTLESVLTYSPTTKGLPFYFGHCSATLSTLMQDEALVTQASKNIGLFAEKTRAKRKQDLINALQDKYQIDKSPKKSFSKIIFNDQQHAKKVQAILFEMGYYENNNSEPKQVLKILEQDSAGNKVTRYAIKFIEEEFNTIFNETNSNENSEIKEPISLNKILAK